GASRWLTLRRITLPLSGSALFGATLFVFFLSAGDYITPVFLGGIGSSATFGTLISDQLDTTLNYPLGAAIAFVMLAVFLAVFVALPLRMRSAEALPLLRVGGERVAAAGVAPAAVHRDLPRRRDEDVRDRPVARDDHRRARHRDDPVRHPDRRRAPPELRPRRGAGGQGPRSEAADGAAADHAPADRAVDPRRAGDLVRDLVRPGP